MSKKLLVIGSTGKQGTAFISSAFQPSSESSSLPALNDVTILALTRNVSSPSAQGLKKLVPEGQGENLKLVQANLDDAASVEKVFVDEGGVGAIWGVLMVLAFPGLGADATGEEKQGKVSLFIVIHAVWLNSNLRDNRHAQIWLWSTRCHISCSHLSNEVAKLMTRMPSWTVWLRFTLRTT